jgi:hypothetical protein
MCAGGVVGIIAVGRINIRDKRFPKFFRMYYIAFKAYALVKSRRSPPLFAGDDGLMGGILQLFELCGRS